MIDNSSTELEVGTVLKDKWVILEFIGKGAMGEVYRAHQLSLKRDIAIKVISREWLEGLDDESEIEVTFHRFRREVEAMAQIRHPNVLQVFDYDSVSIKKDDQELPVEYLAMEYIPGSTLRETMSEDGLNDDEDAAKAWLIDYFMPVLDGVEAIHEKGIVHRDLKPENVLLDENMPKIGDFGLARSWQLKSVTQSIDAKGTPPYMSPEHFFDFRKADEKADIYSLGKILFEAIDGKMPPNTLPFKSAELENPETPFFENLDQIIRSATAEEKKDRYGTIAEFRRALSEAIAALEKVPKDVTETPQSQGIFANPKWIWAGIAAAVLSVGLMTIWHLLGEPGRPIRPSGESQQISQQAKKPVPSVSSGKSPSTSAVPGASLQGKDGVTLRFVPGGKAELPEGFGSDAGKLVDVDPFYMDEVQVTNHQYVEFLNQVLSRITVEKGVVRGEEKIWLLLGEVKDGYEPIVFRKSRFFLQDPALASHPVVRVTGKGASAYARFYGRRLPTATEWLYVVTKGGLSPEVPLLKPPKNVEERHMGMMHQPIMEPSPGTSQVVSADLLPVATFRPNVYGIKGLNENVNEWGLVRARKASEGMTPEVEYLILGTLGQAPVVNQNDFSSPVLRQPWEAFEKVGFRCIQGLSGRNNG